MFKRLLFSFFALYITLASISQTLTAKTVTIVDRCHGYWEYLPLDYNSTAKKYPLIVYMHGAGGYGDGTASDLDKILQIEGLPHYISKDSFPSTFSANGHTTSFIVIAPQFVGKASPKEVGQVIDFVTQNYRVDGARIYLMGFSVGGDVVWQAPYDINAASRLTAIAPIAGYNNPYADTTAAFIAAANLPVWAVHSTTDYTILASASQNMVNKINSFNPSVPAIITLLNNVTHDGTTMVAGNPQFRQNGKSIYEWFLQYTRSIPPLANAGDSIIITLPVNSCSLHGSNSTDPDNEILNYNWTKISGPLQYSIDNISIADPVLSSLVAGIYKFKLTVIDNSLLSSVDSATVTVVNPNPNQLPVASAGDNISISLPQNSVSIDATSSADADGDIETFLWSKISGPDGAVITDSSSSITTVTNLKPGMYQFLLTVTDNEGGSSSDVIQVTVVNPFPNTPPIANAGVDQTITLPAALVLDGSASSDAEGPLVYAWKQLQGPSSSLIVDPTIAISNVSNLIGGTYTFELTVKDTKGEIDKDSVIITVNPEQKLVRINLYGGTIPAGAGWNNWNVTNSNNLTLSSIVYSDGSPSLITAQINTASSVGDNGASYPITMCPLEVGRTSSYSTVTRTITVKGLNANKQYNLEVYASRAVKGNSTRFSIGSSSVDVLTDYNYSNKVLFSSIPVSGGQFQLKIDRLNTWNFINGFILTEISNKVPKANAGIDQYVNWSPSQITLNGSGSNDADGTISSYEWKKLIGPSATITNPNAATTTVTGISEGIYLFQLKVVDNLGAFATDTIQLTVNDPSLGDQINCGKALNIVVLGSSSAYGTGATPRDSSWVSKFTTYVKTKNPQSTVINLATNGFTTYDALCPTGFVPPPGRPSPNTSRNITKALTYNPDVIIINLPSNDIGAGYSMQEIQDNYERTMSLTDARNIPVWVSTSQPRTDFNAAKRALLVTLRDWTYQRFGDKTIDFWTTVADPDGTINPYYAYGDKVHLNNIGHHILLRRVVGERVLDSICLRSNVKPTANAGSDAVVNLPANQIQLNGTSSSDVDGTIVSYLWKKVSGPASFLINDSSLPTPVISDLQTGIYVMELTVTDNKGASARDSVYVTVKNPNNQPPLANAGADAEIILPVNSLQLDGSLSNDPEGSPISYQWSKISGPSQFQINNPNAVSPFISNLTYGTYKMKLTVTDQDGASSSDTVIIAVQRGPNIAPTANAGVDQTITVSSATLNGSSSADVDGVIVSFHWAQLTGPAQAVIANPNSANTAVSSLVAGSYQFELTVTDDSSASDTDTVLLNVNEAPPITQKFIKVNMYGGSTPAGSGWNNWNITSSLNSPALLYSDGTTSLITARMNVTSSVSDNGANYQVTMCPLEVGRTASYSTATRTLTISGLDNARKYNLEVYASRASTGNSTRFSIGTTNITILTDYNSSNKAVFSNLSPSAGQIQLTVSRLNTWNYLNGFILTENADITTTVTNRQKQEQLPQLETGVFRVFPNPFYSQLQLCLNNTYNGYMTIQVFDLNGKLLKHLTVTKTNEFFSKNLSLQDLQKGTYILEIHADKIYTSKLEKIK
jgi:poly(3-hydroxybutyrate) depolymerase/lysophospholipase L1-like esterase